MGIGGVLRCKCLYYLDGGLDFVYFIHLVLLHSWFTNQLEGMDFRLVKVYCFRL